MKIPKGARRAESDLTQSNNSEAPPIERRPKRRIRVLLQGIVSYAGGKHSFHCAIRDITDTGARVAIPKNQQFPSNFYLINIRDRVAYDALIRWNSGKEVGVSFKKTYHLADIADPALSYLRRLWHAGAVS